jgi:hypothetical protein
MTRGACWPGISPRACDAYFYRFTMSKSRTESARTFRRCEGEPFSDTGNRKNKSANDRRRNRQRSGDMQKTGSRYVCALCPRDSFDAS